jgi:UDP-N-acetylglucosamine/UDP-N-acetylgalactosamine diphosphorylase
MLALYLIIFLVLLLFSFEMTILESPDAVTVDGKHSEAQLDFLNMVEELKCSLKLQLEELHQNDLLESLNLLEYQEKIGEPLAKSKLLSFFQQLSRIDLKKTLSLFKEAMQPRDPLNINDFQPIPSEFAATAYTNDYHFTEDGKKWNELGQMLVKNFKIAVITMAGGQGTRLGSSLPKGMYDIGLPSHKSIFELQADRIQALQTEVSKNLNDGIACYIPWYIMTSEPTHQRTVQFFREKNFFGLDSAYVKFFKQSHMPSFDFEGKILMEDESKV